MTKIAVFASGRGSNFQAIQASIEAKRLSAKICVLICDSVRAGAIQYAEERKIATEVIIPKHFTDQEAFGARMLAVLQQYQIQWIVLAGYLKKIPQEVVASYQHRIVNIHPSLLPAFGGVGMYGIHVHQAVYNRGVKVSGATVHLVNDIFDDGPIVAQVAVDISRCNSPQEIAAQVLQKEHELYPETLGKLVQGHFSIEGKRVIFRD